MVNIGLSGLDVPKENVRADVIILGCSLPGIVTAHKLKKRFGDTMDIVVLDLAANTVPMSKYNVVFQEEGEDMETVYEKVRETTQPSTQLIDNVARHYLTKWARDLNIPVPDAILHPQKMTTALVKVFQYMDGQLVTTDDDYTNYTYLNYIERFELHQYQSLLDSSMQDLFQHNQDIESDKKRRRYYDLTTMEQHICSAVCLPTPREIMRTIVRLVCGANADKVSVLFYLHQCYRTSSCRNHLDGNNTRLREKLLGQFRKVLSNKLQKSVADITLPVISIKEIRTDSNEQVILETVLGHENYICNLLAMALRPEQLGKINVESRLMSEAEFAIVTAMMPGRAKKFLIQYEENFWVRDGFSGDIVSLKGPILWAIERPLMGTLHKGNKHPRKASLTGYLRVGEQSDGCDSRQDVIDQLVMLFGEEAAEPCLYKETDIDDIHLPRMGDYLALRHFITGETSHCLEWGTLDIYADGDIAAALEAGHMTYIRLLSILRPQAATYEDSCTSYWPTVLGDTPFNYWKSNINLVSISRLAAVSVVAYASIMFARYYFRR